MRSSARVIWARSFGETELVSALKLTDLYRDDIMSTLGAHHKVRDGLDAEQRAPLFLLHWYSGSREFKFDFWFWLIMYVFG